MRQSIPLHSPAHQCCSFISYLSGLTGTLSGSQATVPSWLASGPPPASAGVSQSVPATSQSVPAASQSVPAASQSVPAAVQAVPTTVVAPSPPPAPSSDSSAVDFLLPSSGLPPIPAKIVQAIKEGKFVDFGDLLPEALREQAFEAVSSQKDEKKKKTRRFYINSPVDWALAFSLYSAVAVHFKPERAFQLSVYASIIMGLARDTRNSQVWLRYDRLFRQAVAVNPTLEWHRREPDLWLMATSDFASTSGYPAQPRNTQPATTSGSTHTSSDEPCRRFNKGSCPFTEAHCRYRHVCRQCLGGGHVARDCPKLPVPSRRPAPNEALGDH